MDRTRTFRLEPMLTPDTAKALVEAFASKEVIHTPSESPDSLYSGSSPFFPNNPAFEYDEEDEDAFDSRGGASGLLDMTEGGEDEDEADLWASPGWGRWPESTRRMNYPSWGPSPRGSIISLSPRGSVDSRRESSIKAPLSSSLGRKESNPSLLGFGLIMGERRRRSSTRSLSSGLGRRRSSMYSTGSGSFVDPMEEVRLRNIASMDMLRRRFSEVVEVMYASEEEEYYDSQDDVAMARANMNLWSPYSDTSAEDDSEVHTASYAPTPELQTASVPTLYSNFPLASVALDPAPIFEDNPSEVSSLAVSPLTTSRFVPPSTQATAIGTPPPPAPPLNILRDRSRPSLARASTTLDPQTRSAGVPPGAGPPRPSLSRSLSNPSFSAAPRTQEAVTALEKRAAGSFPIARGLPLGTSPLRESLRRQSVVSDSDSSRRGSVIDKRVSLSLASDNAGRRKSSLNSDSESARRASLADRRLSLVKESALRRMSGDNRLQSIDMRRSSTRSSTGGASLVDDLTSRRPSSINGARRRQSKDSRKSSVVSIGEYGYLAPQIVIDAPKITPPAETATVLPTPHAPEVPRLRANAPPSIILPSYRFPPAGVPTSPTSSTPRFNPMESFLGRATSPTSGSGSGSGSGSSGSCGLITPTMPGGITSSPTGNILGNLAEPLISPKRLGAVNAGRPGSGSEFTSFPFRLHQPPSPKSSPIIPQEAVPALPGSHDKANVPTHRESVLHDTTRSDRPALATLQDRTVAPELARIKSLDHRRTISIQDMHLALAAERAGQVDDTRFSLLLALGPKRGLTFTPELDHSGQLRPTFRREMSVPLPLPVYQAHEFVQSVPHSQPPYTSHPGADDVRTSPLTKRAQAPGAPPYRILPLPSTSPTPGTPSRLLPAPRLSPEHQTAKAVGKRRSITFADQPSPRSSVPNVSPSRTKTDRTSSFTRFFHSRSGGGSHKSFSASTSPDLATSPR
ncbi:hypothetical protein IAU60_003316 [Kwoniella sp. DSM 27419]